MTIKLHMNKAATTSRAVLLFCLDAGIDVEVVTVNLPEGEHYGEAFTTLNPSRLVPVIEDGDFVLTESAAILRYLARSVKSPAYPSGLKERARVDELLDWFNTNFYRDFGFLMTYPQVFPHHVREGDGANEATVAWGAAKSAVWLKVLDEQWLGADRTYLGGDAPNLADYHASSIITVGDYLGYDFAAYPNVSRWLETMRASDNWGAVHDVHDAMSTSLQKPGQVHPAT